MHFMLIQSLLSWCFLLSSITYSYWHFNGLIGVHIALLAWSFYILLLPAGHGQLLLGYPLWVLTKKSWHPEPLMWLFAACINGYSIINSADIYQKTFLTKLLYRLLTNPYPYWSIILASLPGTYYYFLVHESYCKPLYTRHIFIRNCIVLFGILFFCYAAHQELIILLCASS